MRGSGASGDAHSGRSGGDWTVPGYADEQELGAGAGGRVVTAVHTATGRSVAIKYLSEELSADDAFRDAFRDEAELLGSLQTPHVVRLYEYVESAAGAAIVMELVDGMPLRALLRQEGPTGPEAALVVLKGSLLGLAAAHGSGVVHRDYKPENVLVTRDGQSKLVDFGIARRSGSRAPSGPEGPEGPGSPGGPGGGPEGRAGSEAVTGTPPYMAPEQWTGAPADTATDVYAATVTFYECLTGARPFRGETVIELAVQHTTAPVPVDGLPEPVRGLVLHGMAKSPVDRPENATAFLAELERVAGAAYGPGWEERGRRRLAALAALLPLLFPGPRTAPDGSTALAVTRLPAAPPTMPPPRVPVPGGGGSSLIVTLAALVVAVLVMTGSLVVGWAGENEASAEATTGVPTSSPQDSPSDDGGEGTGGSGSGSDGDEGGDGDGNGGQGGDSIGESSAVGTTGDPGSTGSTGGTGGTSGSGDTGSTGSTSGSGDTGSTGSTPQEETALSAVDITDMWVEWEDADKGGCECWVAYATVVLTVDGPDTVEVAAEWYETSSDRDPGTLVGSETWVVGSDSNGQTLTVIQRNIRGYECGVYYRLDVYPLSPSEGASDSDSVYAGCLR